MCERLKQAVLKLACLLILVLGISRLESDSAALFGLDRVFGTRICNRLCNGVRRPRLRDVVPRLLLESCGSLIKVSRNGSPTISTTALADNPYWLTQESAQSTSNSRRQEHRSRIRAIRNGVMLGLGDRRGVSQILN